MQPNYFFEIDAIDHYRIKIENDALETLEHNRHLSKKEALKRQIIFDEDHPLSILDSQFIVQLEGLGFLKQALTPSQLVQVQAIFSLEQVKLIEPSYCGAVFRDVLVFYKNVQITGMAKLCFSCGHHIIVGTPLSTAYFGQQGDYELLKRLLKV